MYFLWKIHWKYYYLCNRIILLSAVESFHFNIKEKFQDNTKELKYPNYESSRVSYRKQRKKNLVGSFVIFHLSEQNRTYLLFP